MSYAVKLDMGKNYRGLTTLIPGHIYKDNNLEKWLFVGFGRVSIIDVTNPASHQVMREIPDKFVFIKMREVEKRLKWKTLSPDFKYTINNERLSDLMCTLKHPKTMMEDLGELFSDNYFKNFESLSRILYTRGCTTSEEVTKIEMASPGVYCTTSGRKVEVTN